MGEKYIDDKSQENKEKYLAIFETAANLITSVDEKGIIVDCNNQIEKILGYTHNEIINQSMAKIIHPDYLAKAKESLKEILTKGQTYNKEYKMVCKDGRIIDVSINSAGLKDKNGKYVKTICIIDDITERKKMEEALRDSAHKWQITFDAINDAVCLLNMEGQILKCNKTMVNILGKPVSEIVGKTCWELMHNTSEPMDGCPVLRMRKTHCRETLDLQIGEQWFRVTVDPLFNDSDALIGAVHVINDINESKKAEAEIKSSLKEKELLLKEIHHRVKNNLQIITSILNLRIASIKDKQAVEMIKGCQNRIKSMALVHEKMYQSEDLAKINLFEYIQSLTNTLSNVYKVNSKNVELKINGNNIFLDIDKSIPCALLINELITNSLKHAFPDDKKGEIRIDIHLDKNKIFLTIGDNGVGLPKDFDFRNTDSLGFQLVCILVDQLKGTIEVDRSHGTTFKITFSM